MRRGQGWLLAGALAIGGLPGAASAASEVDIVLNKLVEKGILTSEDASQIRREVAAEAKAEQNPQVAKEVLPDSSRNWTWSGDLLLREEYRNRTGSGNDANRQRIRFRYGVEAKVADQLRVGARLTTGNTTDPGSPNQSFSTSFNHKSFFLDRAFVEYSPELPFLSRARLSGGMIENPFWTVGQLVWDDDLSFDGAAMRLSRAVGPVTLFMNDGVFALQTDVTEAASLWSAQGGVIITPFTGAGEEALKHLKLTGSLAYHDYVNLTRSHGKNTAQATAGGLKGNSADLKDLNLLNPTVEMSSQLATIPFGVFGDWVHNTAASSSGEGFQVGLKVGEATVPFDLRKGWEGGYYFERLQPDATFGAFTDSDFGNGGTNHTGQVWWVKLAALKHSAIQLKYYNTHEVKGSKNNADTFRADWISRF